MSYLLEISNKLPTYFGYIFKNTTNYEVHKPVISEECISNYFKAVLITYLY